VDKIISRLMATILITSCLGFQAIQANWLGADTIAESFKQLGKDFVEGTKNLDPTKIQEISTAVQQTIKESTSTISQALGKAFHNTHHTIHHTFDHQPVLVMGQGVCAISTFCVSLGLIYTALTNTTNTVRRSIIQALAGSGGILVALWWLTALQQHTITIPAPPAPAA
jgi:hypothetical protein